MATPSFHRPLKGEAGFCRDCWSRREILSRDHLCLLEQAPVRHSHGHPEAQRDFVTCPDFQATVGNGPSPFSFRNSLEHCVGDFNQQGRF